MLDLFYPFDWLSAQIVTKLFGLSLDSHLGKSLHFFFYDVPKILTLLAVISFVVGTLQTFLEPEKVRVYLEGKRKLSGHILAASLGAVTPFCSCSAVPLFIGFLKAGIPLGITFSYLISAPMVDAVAVFLLFALFGLKITLFYIFFGITLAVITGYVIGLLKLEKWVEPFIWELKNKQHKQSQDEDIELTRSSQMSWEDRFKVGWFQSSEILKSVWIYVIIGIGIGAGIHGYMPAQLISEWIGKDNPFAVLVAVLIGVPLYTNIAGVLPIASALFSKGMPIGTVLSFTMAVTALSLPEMIILRKVLKPKLLGIFISLTTLGIVGVGYLFNAISA
ncbi:permease [Thermosynechococcus sp. CL-1]|uniref:permease n=1 Tax=Thermosynechococcus sp. CL-1 TaxID=2583530 RepID=UPI00122E6873|nr:permease [Thermosynechococcus sp. CL-1]QEP99944.1 permease [Thermosynechococcus sp. CL-1]